MTFDEDGGADCLAALETSEEPPRRHSPPARDVELAVRTLIRAAGDDPERPGLLETPARVARAYHEWFAGYSVDPRALLSKVFTDAQDYEETVLLRDIPLVSTCEHHLDRINTHVLLRKPKVFVGYPVQQR